MQRASTGGGRHDAGCATGFPECRTTEEPGAAGARALAACSYGGASTWVADYTLVGVSHLGAL